MSTRSLENYTVMFADVAGSTKLYEELGDVAAKSVISEVMELMMESIRAFSGIVIKTIGDEVMCRFQSSDNAANASIQIQEKLELGIVQGVFVSVRIGFHTGSAILQTDGDLFGDNVNIAARMASIAKGRQIILTKSTANLLSADLTDKTRQFDKVRVKGKSQEMLISELVWEEAGVTRMMTVESLLSRAKQKLRLTNCKLNYEMASTDAGMQLGRSEECDLTVNAELASRLHAKISVKRGKFVLVDQSTNGTYVKTENGVRHYLRREELALNGSGEISLGTRLSVSKTSEIIYYHVESI